jgi:hypothetical protein
MTEQLRTCRRDFHIIQIDSINFRERQNGHSSSPGASICPKHNSFAGIVADLLLGLFQLKEQVCGADVDFYNMSADTSIQYWYQNPHLQTQSNSLPRAQHRSNTSVAGWSHADSVSSL